MKQSEVDKAKEVLRIKPRPKDVIVRIQLLSAKACSGPLICSGLTNLDTKIALYPSRGY